MTEPAPDCDTLILELEAQAEQLQRLLDEWDEWEANAS